MNQHMRRYLDDDWDELNDGHDRNQDRERDDRKPQRPDLVDRRQRSKEWGRSMAKFHRERKKHGLTSEKP